MPGLPEAFPDSAQGGAAAAPRNHARACDPFDARRARHGAIAWQQAGPASLRRTPRARDWPHSRSRRRRVRCLVACLRVGVPPLSGRDCWPQGQLRLTVLPFARWRERCDLTARSRGSSAPPRSSRIRRGRWSPERTKVERFAGNGRSIGRRTRGRMTRRSRLMLSRRGGLAGPEGRSRVTRAPAAGRRARDRESRAERPHQRRPAAAPHRALQAQDEACRAHDAAVAAPAAFESESLAYRRG